MRIALVIIAALGIIAVITVPLLATRSPAPPADRDPTRDEEEPVPIEDDATITSDLSPALARILELDASLGPEALLREGLADSPWDVLPARAKWARLRALIRAVLRRAGSEATDVGGLVWLGAERLGLELVAWWVPAPLNASGLAGGFLYRRDDGKLASADVARPGEPDPRPSSWRRMRRAPVGWIWGHNPRRGGLYNMTSELAPTAEAIVLPRPEWRPDALVLLGFCLARGPGGSEPRDMFGGPRRCVVGDDDSLEVTGSHVVVRHLGLRVNGLYLLATEGFDRDREDGRILPVGGLFVVETTGVWYPVSSEPPRQIPELADGTSVAISSDVVLAPIPDATTPCRIEKWSNRSAWHPAGWEAVPGELRSKPLLHGRRALPAVVLREGAYRLMCRPRGRRDFEKGVGTHFVVRGGRVIVFPASP